MKGANFDGLAQNEGRRLDIKVYRKGRICKKEDCKTSLSTYTEGSWCHAHRVYGDMFEKELKEARIFRMRRANIRMNRLKKLKGDK